LAKLSIVDALCSLKILEGTNIATKKIALIITIGLITGLINGLLGVGGGTILIPAMVLLLGVCQHEAHGTSLMVIFPTATASAIIYYLHGHVDWRLAALVAGGGIVGGYLGAKLMEHLPDRLLRKVFAVFLIATAIWMVV